MAKCVVVVIYVAVALCFSIYLYLLNKIGLLFGSGAVADAAQLPTMEQMEQQRSVYLSLLLPLVPKDQHDDWAVLLSMPQEEWIHLCRTFEDAETVAMFATVRTRAINQGVNNAVMKQMESDIANYFTVKACTDDDYTFIEKMDMPKMLVPPQKWTRTEEAFSAHVSRVWSALVTLPVSRTRALGTAQCGASAATKWAGGWLFGRSAIRRVIDDTSDARRREWRPIDKSTERAGAGKTVGLRGTENRAYGGTAISSSSNNSFSKDMTISKGVRQSEENNREERISKLWIGSWQEGEADRYSTIYHIRHGEWI